MPTTITAQNGKVIKQNTRSLWRVVRASTERHAIGATAARFFTNRRGSSLDWVHEHRLHRQLGAQSRCASAGCWSRARGRRHRGPGRGAPPDVAGRHRQHNDTVFDALARELISAMGAERGPHPPSRLHRRGRVGGRVRAQWRRAAQLSAAPPGAPTRRQLGGEHRTQLPGGRPARADRQHSATVAHRTARERGRSAAHCSRRCRSEARSRRSSCSLRREAAPS